MNFPKPPNAKPMELHTLTNGITFTFHPDFTKAKSGDFRASANLVNDIFSKHEQKLINLVKSLPDGTILTPIHALEKTGYNAIGLSMAVFISEMEESKNRNLIISEDIYQYNKVHHTGSSAMHRLLAYPMFCGNVEKGKNYFILDDIITSGSTINECRLYIESQGGKVNGAMTICGTFSMNIGNSAKNFLITPEVEAQILIKFEVEELNNLLFKNGITKNYKELTNSQAKYLTSFRDLNSLRNAIHKAKNPGRKVGIKR